MKSRVLFSSKTPNHATPAALYAELDVEFRFTLDPCPLGDSQIWDGKLMSWAGHRVFCNPPYGRGVERWLAKAREADVAVYLLPARTDTAWWHDYALKADEIRFVRGRLRFGNAKNAAPFPSVIIVFRKGRTCFGLREALGGLTDEGVRAFAGGRPMDARRCMAWREALLAAVVGALPEGEQATSEAVRIGGQPSRTAMKWAAKEWQGLRW